MILISDLDKTLIYSDKEKKLKGEKDYLCVEYKDNSPLSYMTRQAYDYLFELNKYIEFIPCTARSLEQLNRISFLKELNLKYIICFNGCEIYKDNKLDLEYDKMINKLIDKNKNISLLKLYSKKYPKLRIRSFNDYYLEIRLNDISQKDDILVNLKQNSLLIDYDIFCVSTKIYLIPKIVNKQMAIDYLKTKETFGKVYALGDSEIDKSFIHNSDYGFVPSHYTFSIDKDNIYKSPYIGILGGEDILNAAIAKMKEEIHLK